MQSITIVTRRKKGVLIEAMVSPTMISMMRSLPGDIDVPVVECHFIYNNNPTGIEEARRNWHSLGEQLREEVNRSNISARIEHWSTMHTEYILGHDMEPPEAIVDVGGATRGKAIIILNPAEPPLMMRDTVYCLAEDGDRDAIAKSVEDMVAEVQSYVPGYRLKQAVQFESIGSNKPLHIPEMGGDFTGLKVSVFLEVEGAAHYLPAYAGNLDIMTSAAMKTAEKIAVRMHEGVAA